VTKAKAELWYSEIEYKRQKKLVPQRASSVEDMQKAEARQNASQAALEAAQAAYECARIKYGSQINGVNTTVARVEAELAQARYYLDNTTMTAPADGYIVNLQVRPGMVVGMVRFGAIASFIVDADRYLLGTYYQEQLKFVKSGQPVEVVLDLYPFIVTIGPGIGRLVIFGLLSVQFTAEEYCMAIHPDDFGQHRKLRFKVIPVLTALFRNSVL